MIKITREGIDRDTRCPDGGPVCIEGISQTDSSNSVAWLRATMLSIMSDAIRYKQENDLWRYAHALEVSAENLGYAADFAKKEAVEKLFQNDTPNIKALYESMPKIEPLATLIQNKIEETQKDYGAKQADGLAKVFLKEFQTLETRYGLSREVNFNLLTEIGYLKRTFLNFKQALNSYGSCLESLTLDDIFLEVLPYLNKLEIKSEELLNDPVPCERTPKEVQS